MPLVRYEIRSEHSLGSPELFATPRNGPEELLHGVAMAGLVGIVRQIGDLAEFAADIFRGLHEEVLAVSARGHDLAVRLQQIEAEMPSIEKSLLSETNQLKFAYNPGTEWHASIRTDQNHCTQGDLPRFIRNSYEECRGPPKLFLLDKFDFAGAGACLKRYTDPSYFKTEWARSELLKAERDMKARRVKRKARRRKGSSDSVDSMSSTQINSRVRYSSRGVELDGASGASSSSQYLMKQSREAFPPNRTVVSTYAEKQPKVVLSKVRVQEVEDASGTSVFPSSPKAEKQPSTALPPSLSLKTEAASTSSNAESSRKQPREGLPTGQVETVTSSSSSPFFKSGHSKKQSKEALPFNAAGGSNGAPGLAQSSVRAGEALSVNAGKVGDGPQVSSPKLSSSSHSIQSSQASSPVKSHVNVEKFGPLKLNAKEIEAEALSGRFTAAEIEVKSVIEEKQQQQQPKDVGGSHHLDGQSGEHFGIYSHQPEECVPSPSGPSDQEAKAVELAPDNFGSEGLEQNAQVDPADDLASETDQFMDALATMESDGETDAEPRLSVSKSTLSEEAEVQSAFCTTQPSTSNSGETMGPASDLLTENQNQSKVPYSVSGSVMTASNQNTRLSSPGKLEVPYGDLSRPVKSNSGSPPSGNYVESDDSVGPSVSSVQLSSAGDMLVMKATSSPPALAVVTADEFMGSIKKVPSPAGTTMGHTSANMTLSVEDLPSPSGTVIFHPSPGNAAGELMSPSESSFGLPSPGEFDMANRDLQSPSGSSTMVASPRKILSSTVNTSERLSVGKVALDARCPSSPSESDAMPSPVSSPMDLPSQAGSTLGLSLPSKVELLAEEVLAASNAEPPSSDNNSQTTRVSTVDLYVPESAGDLSSSSGSSASAVSPGNDPLSPAGPHEAPLSPQIAGSKESPQIAFETAGHCVPPQALQSEDLCADACSMEITSGGAQSIAQQKVSKEDYGNGPGLGPGSDAELEGGSVVTTNDLRDEEQVLIKNAEIHKEGSLESPERRLEDQKAGTGDKQVEFLSSDPLLHMISDEEDDELDDELAKAVSSYHVNVHGSEVAGGTGVQQDSKFGTEFGEGSERLSPAPSPPSPRVHKFSVLDPLSSSVPEANEPGDSPQGSSGSSPRSSVFSVLHSPLSSPPHGLRSARSPGGRSFRTSEIVSPASPTHGSSLAYPPLPTPETLPEILSPLPPMNSGQWHGAHTFQDHRPSVPLEFVRSPSRMPPPSPLPSPLPAPTAPMPTRPAPVAGEQQDAPKDTEEKSELKTAPQPPSILPTNADRELLFQQIRAKAYKLRDTTSSPRSIKESPNRPSASINVAAILEKANAIRQAFIGSEDDDDEVDDENDQWSDT